MVSRKEDVLVLRIIRFCFKLSHTDIFILFDHVVKPGNLLCDGANNRLRLIDFGSGADLDPSSPPSSNGLGNIFSNSANGQQEEERQKQRVGFDESIAALSPIYSAPETFIKLDANPLSFDVFSAAVIMCQLLFNTLDERSNTEFAQQLREVDYDLDAWLENSLGNDEMIGPSRFDDALEYLGERRGLWGLLKKMLQPNPMNRISSAMAFESLREVLALKTGEMKWSDENIARVAREESYLETVIDSIDKCTISYGDGQDDNRPRPLHFLASFAAGTPVGLVLSEAGDDIDSNSDMSEEAKRKWKEATKFAFPGELFVKGWSKNGQADKLGVFEVGDRLRGVGELPFTNAGFEAAVDLVSGSHDITRMICIVAQSHLSLFTLSRVNADRSNGSR
jgi:serine/threonine protein kinase